MSWESIIGYYRIIPDEGDRNIIHDVIYNEQCLGYVGKSSRAQYLRIINKLANQDSQGVIFGCTEIAMLVSSADTDVKLYDITALHAATAVEFAFS